MKFQKTLLFITLFSSGINIVACDKKINTTTTTSPTVQGWADSMKMGTAMMIIKGGGNPTNAQKACLLEPEGSASYYAMGEEEMKRILTSEEMQQSDNFYRSELGKKLIIVIQQQIKIAQGEKITNPIVLTNDEKKEIAKINESSFVRKVQSESQNFTLEKAMEKFKPIIEKEKVRCKIT